MDYVKVRIQILLLFLLFVHLVFVTYAQPTQKQIDSLLLTGLNFDTRGLEVVSTDSAFRLNKKAFNLSEQIKYSRGIRISKLNSVRYFLKRSQPDTALILLNEASKEHMSKKDYAHLAVAQHQVASFYLGLNKYDRAEAYFQSAIENLTSSDRPDLFPPLLQSYGSLFMMRGEFGKALEKFKDVLEKRRQVAPEDYSYHHEYFNIAAAYLRMKDYATALKFARQGTTEKGASGGSAIIASIYLQMNKPDSALIIYRGVYKAALARKDMAHATTTLNSIGGYYTRIGQYDSANIIFRKALSIATREYSSVYVRMAENYEKLNQLDSALLSARKGLRGATKMHYNNEIAIVTLLMSRLFEKIHRTDSALKYLKLHKIYNDSIFTRDLAQKATDLRVQIETIEKEEEIALLKKKNEVDAETRKFLYTLIGALLTTISIVIWVYRFKNRSNRNRLEMEKQLLLTELREKEKALSNHTLQMIHHRNGFMEIEEELKRILSTDESRRFHKIVNIINVNQSLDREWDNFNQYFNNVHGRFYENLKQVSPNLSLHEQRLCALIKMNLASREIATLLNIEVGSVKMAKYRLKKKLNLDEQEDLNEFIGRV